MPLPRPLFVKKGSKSRARIGSDARARVLDRHDDERARRDRAGRVDLCPAERVLSVALRGGPPCGMASRALRPG